ncbi:hypothetical protein DPMN_030050 [Dreissena polymorpha]|uniref:Uncharacterized protein n=1 Tax=Dreissena polymorpha TaxID=45954 RepID=A0A9D4RHP4_DREPO|nr:hypothetical protein DPMN_030050 [Dreissena polymorpha]
MQTIPNPLPEPYTTTTTEGSEPFLVYDNGSETARLLVFASGTCLNLLGGAKVGFMDGTHSTSPVYICVSFRLYVLTFACLV